MNEDQRASACASIVVRVRRLASTLLAAALTVSVAASAARAEIPSVDAYGGEALVLGRPHKASRAGSGAAPTTKTGEPATTSSSAGGETAGKEAESAVAPTGGSGGSSGSGAQGGLGQGAGGSRAGGGGHATGSPSSGAGTSAGAGGASRAQSTPGDGAQAAETAVNAYPTSSPSAGGAGALGTGALVLILVGLALIAGIGWSLRAGRHPA